MSTVKRWSIVVVGCGTANLACVRALASARVANGLGWVGLVDPAVIRGLNGLSCPEYAGHQGKRKVERLGELAREWLAPATVALLPRYAEEMDWQGLLEASSGDGVPGGPLVVLIGLDDWESRVHVIEDLRHAAVRRPDVLPVQVAVERDQAQVTVFGNRWEDGCPICGLPTMPASEPCLLFSADGRLVRGDLQREARAAAKLVVEVVTDYLATGARDCPWVGTKTNLHATPRGSRRFRRHTRRRARMEGCTGPHDPATPLRPRDLLGPSDGDGAEAAADASPDASLAARALAAIQASGAYDRAYDSEERQESRAAPGASQ